jgi:hypothetical protein
MQSARTYHLAIEGLRHKLLEVLPLPFGRGLFRVQAGRAHGLRGQLEEGTCTRLARLTGALRLRGEDGGIRGLG